MEKTKQMYVMCGIPGAGKSTFVDTYKHKWNGDVAVVSRDAIRFSLVSIDEEYFSKENEVWKEFICQIKDSLSKNSQTIVDATHINEGSRLKLLRALRGSLDDVEVVAIVIPTTADVAIQQNEYRKGTRGYVPPTVIRNMAKSFTFPSAKEGFDYIFIYEKETGNLILRIEVE